MHCNNIRLAFVQIKVPAVRLNPKRMAENEGSVSDRFSLTFRSEVRREAAERGLDHA